MTYRLLSIGYQVKMNNSKKKKKIKDNLESSRILKVKASYDNSPPTPKKEGRKENRVSVIDSGLGQDRLGKWLKSYFEYFGVNQTLKMLYEAYKLIKKKKAMWNWWKRGSINFLHRKCVFCISLTFLKNLFKSHWLCKKSFEGSPVICTSKCKAGRKPF